MLNSLCEILIYFRYNYFMTFHTITTVRFFMGVFCALYLLMGTREVTRHEGRERERERWKMAYSQTRRGNIVITVYGMHFSH